MVAIQVFKLGRIRKIRLDLPDNATKAQFLAKVKQHKPYGTKFGKIKGDLPADVENIFARVTPHEVNEDGNVHNISVKLSTLKIFVDDNGEVVGYHYQED